LSHLPGSSDSRNALCYRFVIYWYQSTYTLFLHWFFDIIRRDACSANNAGKDNASEWHPFCGKANEAPVKEYGEKYKAWQNVAHKVLAAQSLMELAGGYKEAFVLLDAVAFIGDDAPAETGKVDDQPEKEYGEKMAECESTARLVLAAQRLLELAGGQEEAFLLLDAVLIAMEGEQAHEQAGEAHEACASNHEILAAEDDPAKEQEGE